ncbi:MAG: N-acetyl sugar amidotransferase, partial [Elusimicrobia bacterium]|nr:N-acetyl sugar amidotransferase [Elusimicrobiota bacterium]
VRKLKPLVVSFDHTFFRPETLANNERTLKKLGVDFLKFRPSWKVVRALMLEALLRKGDFCWQCHTGCFAYPMHIAIKFKVPLLIWGEPSAEYTSYYSYEQQEEVDEKRFNRFVNLGITAEDMAGMLGGEFTLRDLKPFTYPPLKELMALNVRSVCLGSYVPWDVKTQVELIKRELGWKECLVEGVPPEYGYEKIECMVQGVRDYLKYLKRGFGRTTHLASIDIRNQRLTRDEALRLARQYDGQRPASLDVFLEYLGLTEEQFLDIALKHMVSPHKADPASIPKGEPLPDQKAWDRTLPIDKKLKPVQ